jgi:hypothetical protein
MMRLIAILAAAVVPTAAFAHVGDHSHLGLSALPSHALEPRHLMFGILAVSVWFGAKAVRKHVQMRTAKIKSSRKVNP